MTSTKEPSPETIIKARTSARKSLESAVVIAGDVIANLEYEVAKAQIYGAIHDRDVERIIETIAGRIEKIKRFIPGPKD
jgi:hypothetical protein